MDFVSFVRYKRITRYTELNKVIWDGVAKSRDGSMVSGVVNLVNCEIQSNPS